MRFFRNSKVLINFTVLLYIANLPQECVGVKNRMPLKTVSSVTQFFHDNCKCDSMACQCCLKYENEFFNVHQNLCSNLTVHVKNFEMNSKVLLNDVVLFSSTFSGNNVPPFCFPIMPPLPIAGCIKAHSLRQHDNNQIHACSNATLNFMGFDLINFRLGCIDFGVMGIEVVEPNHDSETEVTPEVSLETSNAHTEPTTSAKNFDLNRPICQSNVNEEHSNLIKNKTDV